MDTSQIKKPIEKEFEYFEKLFSESFVTDNPILKHVYSRLLKTKGKQLRPILTLLSAKLCGSITESTYYAALIMELLHTSSLIHDDVVDNSMERRGLNSINCDFGNKVAVLSGDYLLAHVFSLTKYINHKSILNALANLGTSLSDGELLQLMNAEKHLFSEENYIKVITKKTAILFSVCMYAGAESSEKSDVETSEKLRLFGEYLGICFQIKDDIFDYTADESIGKPTGIDVRDKKITLPLIYAYKHSDNDIKKEIISRIKQDEMSDEDVNYLVNIAIKQGGIDYAYKIISNYQDMAIKTLCFFEDGDAKDALKLAVKFVGEREK